MHLCAAAGVPTVALFGPTDPALWKPAGERIVAIRAKDGPIETLAVENVFQAVEKLLHDLPTSGASQSLPTARS
jgi:ADP-heptose:LPS heptosyltransferase